MAHLEAGKLAAAPSKIPPSYPRAAMPLDASKITSASQTSCLCSAKPLPHGVRRAIDSRSVGSVGDAVVWRWAAGASLLALAFPSSVFRAGGGKSFQVPCEKSTLCRKPAKQNGVSLA